MLGFHRKACFTSTKSTALFLVLLNLSNFSFAQQKSETAKEVNYFSSAASVTTKGISTVPAFTLGKPAVIFDMSMGRRLRFEPQFRFALEGKPWTFLFWWRYKLLAHKKFAIALGTHPALAFRTRLFSTNGLVREIMVAQRYVAGELAPTYLLTKNMSLGMYYLYSYGVEKDVVKNNHYLAARTIFSQIKLFEQFVVGFTPQIYYLKLDRQDGLYYSSTLTLARKDFPLSLSSIITKTIQTDIGASQNLLWNVTLIYSFNKKIVEL